MNRPRLNYTKVATSNIGKTTVLYQEFKSRSEIKAEQLNKLFK